MGLVLVTGEMSSLVALRTRGDVLPAQADRCAHAYTHIHTYRGRKVRGEAAEPSTPSLALLQEVGERMEAETRLVLPRSLLQASSAPWSRRTQSACRRYTSRFQKQYQERLLSAFKEITSFTPGPRQERRNFSVQFLSRAVCRGVCLREDCLMPVAPRRPSSEPLWAAGPGPAPAGGSR